MITHDLEIYLVEFIHNIVDIVEFIPNIGNLSEAIKVFDSIIRILRNANILDPNELNPAYFVGKSVA